MFLQIHLLRNRVERVGDIRIPEEAVADNDVEVEVVAVVGVVHMLQGVNPVGGVVVLLVQEVAVVLVQGVVPAGVEVVLARVVLLLARQVLPVAVRCLMRPLCRIGCRSLRFLHLCRIVNKTSK